MWSDIEGSSTHSNALRMNSSQLVCRLCMVNCGATMEPIFHASTTCSIADKIVSVTRLSLQQGDGLPALVCQQCIFQLDVADTFIKRCVMSDKSLRSLLPKVADPTIRKPQTKPYNAGSIPVPSTDHVIISQSTSKTRREKELTNIPTRDQESRPNNMIQKNLEQFDCPPTFEAVDLALPEDIILENVFEDEGAVLNSYVTTATVDDTNRRRHLFAIDPLLGIKCETLPDTASCEEAGGGPYLIKREILENEQDTDNSSGGAFNENSDFENNVFMKTGDLMGPPENCDMHGDGNILFTRGVPNSLISTSGSSESETSLPQNQSVRKKHLCHICKVVLATRWSLVRHLKGHERNKILQQRRLAYKSKNKPSSIVHSKIICPIQALSENAGQDNTQSAETTRCSGAGAEEIAIPTEVPHEIRITLETSRNKCSTFASHRNRVWRKLHDKKITEAYLKKLSSYTQQTIADQKLNQLNMTPIVKLTRLIQLGNKQSIILSAKQSSTAQVYMLTKENSSTSNQKSAGSKHVQFPFDGLPPKAVETEMEWDYHQATSFTSDTSSRKCGICNAICRSKSRLKSHMRSHTGERPYQCPLCNKRYQEAYSLKRHLMYWHAESREFIRRKFHSSFVTANQLRRRAAMAALHKCLDCGKKFASKCSLESHSITHSDARPWKCGKCGTAFKRFHDMLKHQKYHKECITNAVKSSTKTIQKENTLALETDSSQVLKNEPFKLKVKNLEGLGTNNLALRKSRRKEETPTVELCSDQARSSSHACETCGKVFREKHHLISHSVVHSTERPWKCKSCGVAYKFLCSLRQHERDHQLKKKMGAIESSAKHKLIDNGDKYKTNLNGLPLPQDATNITKALTKNTKKRQNSTKIQELKTHKCTICSKTFRLSKTLQFHILTHFNDRPWSCEQCHFAFKRKDALVRHILLRNHKSSINPSFPQNEQLSSTITSTSKNLEENDCNQTRLSENLGQNTLMINEPIVSEPLIRLETLAQSDNDKHLQLPEEINESAQKIPSPGKRIFENSDGHCTETLLQIVTGSTRPSQAVESEIMPMIDSSEGLEVLKKLQGSSQMELTLQHEEGVCNDTDDSASVECSIQIKAEILTNINHPEEPNIHKEKNESSTTECLPPHEDIPHTEETSSEPLKPIDSKCTKDVASTVLPGISLKEEILEQDTDDCGHNELSPLQNSDDNAQVFETETDDKILEGSLEVFSNPEILTVDHEMNEELCKTSHSELQESSAEISEEIYSSYHQPVVKESSNDLTRDSKEIFIIPAAFSESSTPQISNTADIETFSSKHPCNLQSGVVIKESLGCTEFGNVCYGGGSCDKQHTGEGEKTVPLTYKQLSTSGLKPRINDQLIDVTAKNNENIVIATPDCQSIWTRTTSTKEIHNNSSIPLNLQHSSMNNSLINGVIHSQEQISNLKRLGSSEECNPEIPISIAQTGEEKSQGTIEMPQSSLCLTDSTSKQLCLPVINTNKFNHHQSEVAQVGNLYRITNVCQNAEFSDIVVEKVFAPDCLTYLKLLGAEKMEVVPLNVDKTTVPNASRHSMQKNEFNYPSNVDQTASTNVGTNKPQKTFVFKSETLPIINSHSNKAAFLATSSGGIPVKAPLVEFSFRSSEICNRQPEPLNKGKPVNKRVPVNEQRLECELCGKRFSRNVYLVKHMRLHKDMRRSFVCEGCNRPFNVTGNLGCNCLAS